MAEALNPETGMFFRLADGSTVFARYATEEEDAARYAGRGMGGLGTTAPARAGDSIQLFGFNVPPWLIVAGAVAAFVVFGSGGLRDRRELRSRFDELGNERAPGERFYVVSYTSPDAEYIIDKEVSAKSEKQAISRMKQWAKEEGEPTRGARWDADPA